MKQETLAAMLEARHFSDGRFTVIKDAYNVELPISEIGYIYDIVTAK